MSSPLTVEIDHALAIITFNNPARANALDLAMAQAFAAAIEQVAGDKSIRALLITANGKQFCVGGDVNAFADTSRPLVDTLRGLLEPVHAALRLVSLLEIPVVCAINGAVGGGGIGLGLCGDIVLAAESMKLRGGYSAIGLTPDVGGSWFVTRRAGAARARDIFLTNRPISSAECLHMGLVDAVHPDAELASAARALGHQLAKGPAQAQARIKALISAASHHSLLQHLDAERDSMFASGETEDGHEGIRAFIEKRAPKFN
jgi:2-(1,2-epoxy-1,2-dihydrophenyl)acetyl-CoA isomerase